VPRQRTLETLRPDLEVEVALASSDALKMPFVALLT